MTFLPIVARELRVAARRAGTHWLRLGSATAVILVVFVLAVTASVRTPSAELSQSIFLAVGILGLGLALFAGAFLTAQCLSAERQEGTLGLLFLADLKGYDIVLGKLAASSVNAVLVLLAIVPVLGLPLLMGGVTVGEFARMALVLLVTLYFSLSVGMFLSALNREARNAMAGSLGVLVLVAGVLPTLWWMLYISFEVEWFRPLLLWPSPIYLFWALFEQNYYNHPATHEGFWISCVWLVSAGTVLLAGACRVLPRCLKEVPRVPGELADVSNVSAGRRRGILRGKPGGFGHWALSPAHWLALRLGKPLRYGWWSLVGIAAISLAGCFILWVKKDDQGPLMIATFSAYGLHLVLKCLVAMEAGRRLHEDRASGALELLLTTPLPSAGIIQAQRHYLGTIFRWPLWLAVALNAILVFQMALDNFGMGSDERTIFLEIYGCGLVLLLADHHALVWVGMCESLRRRRHHVAVMMTLAKVMGAPWLSIFLFVFLAMGNVIDEDAMRALVIFWATGWLIMDLVLWTKARRHLQKNFRDLIAELPLNPNKVKPSP